MRVIVKSSSANVLLLLLPLSYLSVRAGVAIFWMSGRNDGFYGTA